MMNPETTDARVFAQDQSVTHKGCTPAPWRWMQRGDFSVLERNEEPSRFPILKIANAGLLPIGPDAALIADAPSLLAENERLSALLAFIASRTTCDHEPAYVARYVETGCIACASRAALAATKG